MSNKFDTDAYVSRWDNILIPVMLIVIFGSMIAVYALNVMVKPDCLTHDYVFCGTPLDQPAAEGGHGGHGGGAHDKAGHGDSHSDPHGAQGHDHGHDHPH